MARLVRQDPAIERPRPAPGILIVIVLAPAPAYAHRTEYEFAETTRVKSFPQLYDRYVESILFDDEQLDGILIAHSDHFVRVVERQRHRLFDDDVFSVLGQFQYMPRVKSAFRQHHDHVELLPRAHLMHVE